MTFMLYVPSQPFLKARVYLSVILNAYQVLEKGRCVVAGCRKLSAKHTGFELMRGVFRDTHTGTSGACGARI